MIDVLLGDPILSSAFGSILSKLQVDPWQRCAEADTVCVCAFQGGQFLQGVAIAHHEWRTVFITCTQMFQVHEASVFQGSAHWNLGMCPRGRCALWRSAPLALGFYGRGELGGRGACR